MSATKKQLPAPSHRYWDDNLKVWVSVYPMKLTATYKRRTGATWKTSRKG
jgi:hypothetical protein